MPQNKGWTFVQLPIWILCDDRLSDGAKILLAYLRWRQGKDMGCWPSRAKIAKDLHISKKTVSNRLRELEKCAYVITIYREGASSIYVTNANPNSEDKKYTPDDKTQNPLQEVGLE